MRMVKIMLVIGIMAAIAIPAFGEEVKRTAAIAGMKGDVEIMAGGQKSWAKGAAMMVLNEGDTVRTGKGSWALLNINGKAQSATAELGENSEILLLELVKDDDEMTRSTMLDLSAGGVTVKAKNIGGEKSKFEVKTPTSVIAVQGGSASFSVNVEKLQE